MREAFHFDYGVPFTDLKYCAHQNKMKFACCKKEPKLLPCVNILTADREHTYDSYYLFYCNFPSLWLCLSNFCCLLIRLSQHTLWLDEEQKHDDELDSLEENAFWDSPSRRRYHAITGPRLSQLSAASQKIYEYENDDDEIDDFSEDVDSGDDFIDL